MNGIASPAVSVVMGVYNEAALLPQALDSLLNQDFTDLEIVVVDDGSQDQTWSVLTNYAARDRRVRPLGLPRNGGLTAALNHGLAAARAPLIARLDADDQALPHRLSRQMAFMQQHEEVVLLGGGWEVQEGGGCRRVSPPQEDVLLRWHGLFANPFCHSTTLFRRRVATGLVAYNPDFPYAQDYELWIRLMQEGKTANLAGEPLVRRHVRRGGISSVQGREQRRIALSIANGQQRRLLPDYPLSLEESARLRLALYYPQPFSAVGAEDFRTLLAIYRGFAPHHPAKHQRWVSRSLASALLATVSGRQLGIAWRSGFLWDLLTTAPLATMICGERRISGLFR